MDPLNHGVFKRQMAPQFLSVLTGVCYLDESMVPGTSDSRVFVELAQTLQEIPNKGSIKDMEKPKIRLTMIIVVIY